MSTTGQRFTRQSRLLNGPSFSRVFDNARRSSDRFFTVLYRKGEDRPARLGFAISKKNCRLSVGRNRIKRIVRESFRHHQTELTGIDIVVLNKAETHKAENKALFASLSSHWRRCQNKEKAPRDKG